MNKAERYFIYASISVLCLPLYYMVRPNPKASKPENILVRHINLSESTKAAAWDMARLALSVTNVPGGIVLADKQSDQIEHSYTFQPSSPLREVLDAIVLSDDAYAWDANRGVVNVVPRRGIPPILETRIAEFNSQDLTTLTAAVGLLLRSPEVRKRMQELNYGEGFNRLQGYYPITQPGILPPKSPDPLSIHVKNASLLDALNAIVRAHGRGVWIYREYSRPQGKHFFEVSITGE